jgi:23S rRNA pseudouridine2457 synthase
MRTATRPRLILFYKPYGVLSQFTGGSSGSRWQTLQEFGPFPRDVYAAGRLDADSEGLLLLTNDRPLIRRLLEPRFGHRRTYLVQVEGIPSDGALEILRSGSIIIDGKRVLPAGAEVLDRDPELPPRPVPIRERRSIPTSWIQLTLVEGKNRQVRRMTAAVGHPTLRLVRSAIGPLTIDGLAPGKWRALSETESARFLASLSSGPTSRRDPYSF